MRLLSFLLVLGCSSAEAPQESPAPAAPAETRPSEAAPEEEPAELPEATRAEPEEPAADALPEDPCPVLGSDRSGSGRAPSVNGEDVSTDVDALAGSLPARVGGLARTGEVTSWARGDAGHWSPGASAAYPFEDDEISIQIDDLVHVCTCAAGMGDALQQRRVHELEGSSAKAIGGHPAVSSAHPDLGAKVMVWVNDRCSVTVSGYASTDRIETIAGDLAWPAIAAACPAL